MSVGENRSRPYGHEPAGNEEGNDEFLMTNDEETEGAFFVIRYCALGSRNRSHTASP